MIDRFHNTHLDLLQQHGYHVVNWLWVETQPRKVVNEVIKSGSPCLLGNSGLSPS